jgi:hypothetical protein
MADKIDLLLNRAEMRDWVEKEFKNQSAKRKTIELLRRNPFLPQIIFFN